MHARMSHMQQPYNIIPINNPHTDHNSTPSIEVHAATSALHSIGDLRKPLDTPWLPHYDLLDWLALFFGFQSSSVLNQREHIVLQLANAQMHFTSSNQELDFIVVHKFRCKLLENYSSWCSFLQLDSAILILDSPLSERDNSFRRELLYVCLYLLIWGESANLRFAPECICYIFHHMALELNKILDDEIDNNTGCPFQPWTSGENGFLNNVVKPIYETIKAEFERSKNGTAPPSSWRNYDDINEYFWSMRCFEKLDWPMRLDNTFFRVTNDGMKVGKTMFVEHRSFLNIYMSFDKIWVMLIVFLQAAIIFSWGDDDNPRMALQRREVQVRLLSIFITWSGMRLFQALFYVGMQWSLVSRENWMVGVRMVLKVVVGVVWVLVFWELYLAILRQKNIDGGLFEGAHKKVVYFLLIAVAFLVPEIMCVVRFIFSWIGDRFAKLNCRIFGWFKGWFHDEIFVGRGLNEGLVDKIKYTLFWLVVLGTKFTFSYFMQIRPMIVPTKNLLNLNVKYEWHEFFSNSNRVAIGLLWLPIVLIYIVDMQIWYVVYSSLASGAMGLCCRLGEIQNTNQVIMRFQHFARAVQTKLIPDQQLPNGIAPTVKRNIHNVIHCLKLRYGFGLPKLKVSEVEAFKFALIWNEIILTFREEDIINDHEVELLEIPHNTWSIKVIQWPCFLLSNQLLIAIAKVEKFVNPSDRELWAKISKNEYMRCAVVEAYYSVKHFLLDIVGINTGPYSIISTYFQEIDYWIQHEKFTERYKLTTLREVHEKTVKLLELVLDPNKDLQKVSNCLQALYETAIGDFPKEKRSVSQLIEDGLTPSSSTGSFFFNVAELPDSCNESFCKQARRLHTILKSHGSMLQVPVNLEARRRITFLSNSLFMNMPLAPRIEKMLAFNVSTNYCNEEVIYGKQFLRTENESGISLINYLQSVYADEWRNFLERMKRDGMLDDEYVYTTRQLDLRLWASYRGQTLARTVRGSMYYYRALKMFYSLESASDKDVSDGARELSSWRSNNWMSSLNRVHKYDTARLKFSYVVSCKMYGVLKEKKDPCAYDILYLMKKNEFVRVAYVDEVLIGRYEKEFYSVLVKYDQQLEKEVEIYRIKLPGPLNLREEKLENQNNAVIFTRGDAIQTIDMNQDIYFEEALKMRNLLEEFGKYHGNKKPTVLGVGENISTRRVSSLDRFMSAREMSFVTLGQRFLSNLLKVRILCGRSDVFDRFWFLTRGGTRKASRDINPSVDNLVGFNCMLRGGNVSHYEYIQVGRGIDVVDLNQIAVSEAKVASGNGEQVLSREVYRLGHRLDFFRMLSYFYSSVGVYFNNLMVVVAVYVFLWGRLYLALSGVEASIIDGAIKNNRAIVTVLNQQFIIHLGLFVALPMFVENYLECGFLASLWEFLTRQLQLSSMFHVFSMGTSCHYFGRSILHGGAKYGATSNDFVMRRKSFVENYMLYAKSHFLKSIELGLILTISAAYSTITEKTFAYTMLSISGWFLVLSWTLAPFVFNLSGFDYSKTVYDFGDFMNWISNGRRVFVRADQSWERWWYEQHDHLRTTSLWGKVLEITLNLRFFFFQYGIVYQLRIAQEKKGIAVYLLSWIYIIVALAVFMIITYARVKYAKQHKHYRSVQFIVIVFSSFLIVTWSWLTHFRFTDLFTNLFAFIPTGWGLVSISQVLRPFLEKRPIIWETTVSVARFYNIIFGIIVLTIVALLSFMPGFGSMQTTLLFSEALSRGLRLFQTVTGRNPRKTTKSFW
ncbi:hypothetical protein LIER_16469 [Lithospermum erythrorhizon]|uniref:1,3-beta-glucan synthase n=1 Tax=Lithospermum erythrorhizon TaxID=34254 RepID=A0AAV3Q6T0_LITER